MNTKNRPHNEEYYNNLRKELQGYSNFIDVLRTKKIDLIKLALEWPTLNKYGTYDKINPLSFSIMMDNPEIVKLLIDNGFNPNNTFENHTRKKFIQIDRPLFSIYSSYKNYDKIIKILVDAGANPNAPDYYCNVCKKDGIFCSDEFSHRCKNNVDELCRDSMIKALSGDDEKIVDSMINNGYNYKNRRLIAYLKHPRCGIFFNGWNTMYRLYSIDEKYFYEALSQDGFFATECKKYKNAVISYKGDKMTLESFYKSQTKKYYGTNTVSLLIAAYYYDDNSLLSRDYLCLDMFRLIIKEYGEQLTDLYSK